MNDRLKFRVWDKKSNNYIKVKMFYIDKFGELFKYEQSKSTVYINAPSPYVMCLCGNNYIVEQCTGLRDKNGKLIYDGDYIRAVNQDTKDRPDLQVGHIWVDEMGCRWIKFKTEELSWNDFCSLIDYDATLEIEVIGNEHEERNFEQI